MGDKYHSDDDVVIHAAELDAHIRSFMQELRTGYYFNPWPIRSRTTQALVADQLYLMPFIVPRDLTIDRLGMRVSAGDAGKIARLGIYKNGVNLYPGDLVIDAGTVDVSAAAGVAATIDQALTKGLYWIALVSDGTPTIYAAVYAYQILGQSIGNLDPDASGLGYHKAAVGSGALADPCVDSMSSGTYGQLYVLPRLKSLD